MCVTEGFPSLPFFVDTDLTRPDGIVRCREVTTTELVQIGWRMARVLKLLTRVPIIP